MSHHCPFIDTQCSNEGCEALGHCLAEEREQEYLRGYAEAIDAAVALAEQHLDKTPLGVEPLAFYGGARSMAADLVKALRKLKDAS